MHRGASLYGAWPRPRLPARLACGRHRPDSRKASPALQVTLSISPGMFAHMQKYLNYTINAHRPLQRAETLELEFHSIFLAAKAKKWNQRWFLVVSVVAVSEEKEAFMFLCSGNIFPGVNPTNDEIRTDQCSFNKASSTATNTEWIYPCHIKYFDKRPWLTALIHSRGVIVVLCCSYVAGPFTCQKIWDNILLLLAQHILIFVIRIVCKSKKQSVPFFWKELTVKHPERCARKYFITVSSNALKRLSKLKAFTRWFPNRT